MPLLPRPWWTLGPENRREGGRKQFPGPPSFRFRHEEEQSVGLVAIQYRCIEYVRSCNSCGPVGGKWPFLTRNDNTNGAWNPQNVTATITFLGQQVPSSLHFRLILLHDQEYSGGMLSQSRGAGAWFKAVGMGSRILHSHSIIYTVHTYHTHRHRISLGSRTQQGLARKQKIREPSN